MEFSNSDIVTVLLRLLDSQTELMKWNEERQQRWFEWAASLLLAAFGAVVVLGSNPKPLPYAELVKSLATVLIFVPTILIISRIWSESYDTAGNGAVLVHIEELLHLFEADAYGPTSPYPPTWAGDHLKQSILKRRTPMAYALILGLMAVSVVLTIWLVL